MRETTEQGTDCDDKLFALKVQVAKLLVALDRECRLRKKYSARLSKAEPGESGADIPPGDMTPESCTVIIPTHRKNPYLKKAVKSCLEQTGCQDGIRVLICANGDDVKWLAKIKKAYADNDSVKVLYTEVHDPNAARRMGVKNVETPFFTFLDDDDMLSPGFIAHLGHLFVRKNVNIVVGRYENRDEAWHAVGGNEMWQRLLREVGTEPTNGYRELSPFLSSFCFKMYRTSFFRKAFRISDSVIPLAEDTLFWVENYAAMKGYVCCDSADSGECYMRRLTKDSRSRSRSSCLQTTHIGNQLRLMDILAATALDDSKPMPVRFFAVSKIQAAASLIDQHLDSLDEAELKMAMRLISFKQNPFAEILLKRRSEACQDASCGEYEET